MQRQSMTLSYTGATDNDAEEVGGDTPEGRSIAMRNLMEEEMANKFNLHPKTASVGVKAAMRLMAGLKKNHAGAGDGATVE